MTDPKTFGFVAKSIICKLLAIAVTCLIVTGILVSRDRYQSLVKASAGPDAKKAKAAFIEASKVFFSPRCANCHAAGDGPTQGDSMKPHDPEMVRGTDGRGTEDLQCNACHMDKNQDEEGMPPGVPDWHMPPADHKMVIQGLTVGQLCRQIKDPAENGGMKTPKDSLKHMDSDPKVLWAWNPGNGRTLPPMTHADFMKKMNEWAANGAACPE
jgi:mono/diheme cytochrome c family protein